MVVWAARVLIYEPADRVVQPPWRRCVPELVFFPFLDSISVHRPQRRARLGTQLSLLSGSPFMRRTPPATGVTY